jgi:hypothetical protein
MHAWLKSRSAAMANWSLVDPDRSTKSFPKLCRFRVQQEVFISRVLLDRIGTSVQEHAIDKRRGACVRRSNGVNQTALLAPQRSGLCCSS